MTIDIKKSITTDYTVEDTGFTVTVKPDGSISLLKGSMRMALEPYDVDALLEILEAATK